MCACPYNAMFFQAVRLTVTGNEIETLGQELRTRPFVYSDAAQLDLDSLVMYTSNLNMSVSGTIDRIA